MEGRGDGRAFCFRPIAPSSFPCGQDCAGVPRATMPAAHVSKHGEFVMIRKRMVHLALAAALAGAAVAQSGRRVIAAEDAVGRAGRAGL